MGKRFVAAALSMALPLGGCVSLPEEPSHQHRFSGALTAGERDLLGERKLEVGIALSGGGLRASLYAAGALRALYETGTLQGADVLSTVSGGGYTGYWTYSGQIAHDERQGGRGEFGSARFGDTVFARSLCQRLADANFVTFPQMVGNGAIGRARQLYERRIGETFGRDDQRLTFGGLARHVSAGYPHLIVNTTVLKPAPTGWRDGLYELTPAGARWGGREDGAEMDSAEARWSADWDVPYRRAVAASGAAIDRLLYRTLPEPPRSKPQTVGLRDGGKSENLGAIALIRRGVPTIVVIDAEHDADYGFGAYENLQRRLRAWGGDIVIPELDEFLKVRSGRELPPKSYFVGSATVERGREPFTTTVHYVKMSMTRQLDEQLEGKWGEMARKKIAPPDVARFQALMKEDVKDGRYDCELPQGTPLPGKDFFGYVVQRYGTWWNGTRRARSFSGGMSLNFPQYTTFDQSMYRDQAASFIGLGYLQALQVPRLE